MSDIRTCYDCGEQFHMDYGACDLDNTIWILTKDGHVKLCKVCIREYKKKGIEWLKNEIWADTGNFDEQKLIEAIKELENRLGEEI